MVMLERSKGIGYSATEKVNKRADDLHSLVEILLCNGFVASGFELVRHDRVSLFQEF